jgi:Holliday junction resolvase RusA-like endonuclease
MVYIFSLQRKGMSFNSAYPTNKMGRRFLTREGKDYKMAVFYAVREQVKSFSIPDDHVLSVTYLFCMPNVFTKGGLPSKTALDTDNLCKLFQDSMCEALGIDDSIIFEIKVSKVFQEVATIYAKIEVVPKNRFLNPSISL